MLRKNPCAFFNTLYAVYWQQNPDDLTVDQFIYYLSPELIKKCNHLVLLVDTLQKRIGSMMEPYLRETRDDYTNRRPAWEKNDHYFYYPHDFTKMQKFPKMDENYTHFKETLSNIKQTQKITHDQQNFLENYFISNEWMKDKDGKTTRTSLLLARIQQLASLNNAVSKKASCV